MSEARGTDKSDSAQGFDRFKRYYRKRTQTKLSYVDLLSEQIVQRLPKEDVSNTEFGTSYLTDLCVRAKELEALQWRMVIYGSIPIVLLFLSIIGVKWEVSALGVQLSDLQAIKEIVLMVSTCITAYIVVLGHRAFVIERTVDVVGERIFGKEAFALYRLRLPRSFNSYAGDFPYIKNERYQPTAGYVVTQVVWIVSLLMSLVLFIILSVIPGLYVVVDVWNSPTWPILGRAADVLCALVYTMSIASSIGVYGVKFRFVDLEKTIALKERMHQDPKSVIDEVMTE